jgi:hypothetical protein
VAARSGDCFDDTLLTDLEHSDLSASRILHAVSGIHSVGAIRRCIVRDDLFTLRVLRVLRGGQEESCVT